MYGKIKRIFDVIGAIVGLALVWPIMLIIAIVIKWSNPKGSVCFTQDRPGKDEKIFRIYKFRTMGVEQYDGDGRLLSDIERMTSIGKFLRKTSLDELPQLWNVLRGNMSFIGPRPLLVQYLKHYNEEQRRRHDVRPGITGWAQINGRNAISWDEKFELDVWYVDHMNLKTDGKVLLKTIKNVLESKDINASEQDTMTCFGE